MTRKKSKLDIAAEKITEILVSHMETMSPAQARAMRKDIHGLAVKSSRSANRGKAARSRKSVDSRPLSRSAAKSS
jgi:hypothetical protein